MPDGLMARLWAGVLATSPLEALAVFSDPWAYRHQNAHDCAGRAKVVASLTLPAVVFLTLVIVAGFVGSLGT